jgi:hypothetical protein
MVLIGEAPPQFFAMPLSGDDIDFHGVLSLITAWAPKHIYLERAVSFGMGIKGAFNYGRGFAAIEIAIKLAKVSVTYVEPNKWTKELCEGIDKRLKAKERSLIALRRLFPRGINGITKNKNGKLHDGMVDALLIAEYGRRKQGIDRKLSPKDF